MYLAVVGWLLESRVSKSSAERLNFNAAVYKPSIFYKLKMKGIGKRTTVFLVLCIIAIYLTHKKNTMPCDACTSW